MFSQVKHFSADEGLPSQRLYNIVADNKGFLWCATEKGIAMYNGNNFIPFTVQSGLPINDLYNIIPTSDGKIWYFGKSSSLGYIENGKVNNFESADGSIMNPSNYVISGNNVGFYYSKKTYILQNDKWLSFTLSEEKLKRIDSIESSLSNIIVNPLNNSIIIYNGEKLICADTNFKIMYKYTLNEKNWHHRNWIKHGYFENNMFCLGTLTHLYLCNLSTGGFKIIDWNGALGSNNQSRPTLNYYLGELSIIGSKGKYVLNNDSLKLVIPVVDSLSRKGIMGICKDYIGNIWINTRNDGLYKKSAFTEVPIFFKNKNIQKASFFADNLYLGIEGEGLFRFNLDTKRSQCVAKDLVHFYKLSNFRNEFLEVLTSFDHFNYNGLHTKSLKFLMEKGILSLGGKTSFISNDSLFLASTYDFWVVDNVRHIALQRFPLIGAYAIEKYNKTLFIGTNNGLKVFFKDKIVDISRFKSKPVKCLKVWKNLLIIGTDGLGVFYFDGQKIHSYPYLNNMIVNSIYVDAQDRLWIASMFGIHFAQLSKYKNKIFISSILQSHGLICNQVNDVNVLGDKVYCATERGLNIIEYKKVKYRYNPSILLHKISINDSNFFYKNKPFTFKSNSSNRVIVSYNVGFFGEQNQLSYYYKLDPVETNWIETHSNEIIINRLDPGSYKLYIKVKGLNGSESCKKIEFSIQPNWYEKKVVKYFITALAVFIFITLVILTSRRVNLNLKKKYWMQKRIVDIELEALRSKLSPHFIFNTINSIQYYINENDIRSSEKYLLLFSSHLRKVFEYSHEDKLSLDKEIQMIEDYLALEMMRFEGKIAYTIKIDSNLDIFSSFIPSMLLQPFIENAIKHGLLQQKNNPQLYIEFFRLTSDTYRVLIGDNGKGIQKKVSLRKSSTVIIDERIDLLNQSGKWLIVKTISNFKKDVYDKGTIICMDIKYFK